MKGIIYKYTSPSNKSYIGQTIQGELRRDQHRRNAYNINYEKYYLPFYCAIRKYGFDSFSYEILKTIEYDCEDKLFQELDRLEIYYIGKYNAVDFGYNTTLGGRGLSGKSHPNNRKVAQYDLEGNFITIFDSGAQAAKSMGLKDPSYLLKCCKAENKTSAGFQWRYVEDDIIIYNISPLKVEKKEKKKYFGKDNKRSKKVYQYDLDENFIREWDSIMDIKRELGYDSGCISRVCNGKLSYYGKRGCEKFIWSYIKLHDV